MNERNGWLWTIALVVVALFVHDWLVEQGRTSGGAGSWLKVSRWDNLLKPGRDRMVPNGIAPNASGTVPEVDGRGGKECGCTCPT